MVWKYAVPGSTIIIPHHFQWHHVDQNVYHDHGIIYIIDHNANYFLPFCYFPFLIDVPGGLLKKQWEALRL